MNAKTKIKPAANKAVYTKIPPNPKRLIHALREMGYTSYDAISDLIDNSIDAKARRIDITIKGDKPNTVIDILDDGIGMDKATVREALRFGSESEHAAGVDLGKYGMGLNTAGISLAREIWVLTRQDKQQAYSATFDIDAIERENDFVLNLTDANGPRVFDTLGDHGTLVRLSRIDRPGDTNVARFAEKLRDKIGQVYRHFINEGLKITVNNRIVEANDPLMLKHKGTDIVFDKDITLAAGKVAHLTVVELPDLGEANREAGILPANSGIYVVRNNRQIMEAQHFGYKGIVNHHHSYQGFRAELRFDGSLDDDFHVDIRKGTIHPDHRMLERLGDILRPMIEASGSGKRGRNWEEAAPVRTLSHAVAEERIAAIMAKPKKAADPVEKPITFSQGPTDTDRFYDRVDGQIKYNDRHPFIRHMSKQPGAMPVVGVITFALSEIERDDKNAAKVIEKLSEFLVKAYSVKL